MIGPPITETAPAIVQVLDHGVIRVRVFRRWAGGDAMPQTSGTNIIGRQAVKQRGVEGEGSGANERVDDHGLRV
jgi:hypothetical protein